jgi:hypothetical protein
MIKSFKSFCRIFGAIAVSAIISSCIIVVIEAPTDDYYYEDEYEEYIIKGKVIEKETGKAIPYLAVLLKDVEKYPYSTNYDGTFTIYINEKKDSYTLVFTDVDGSSHGGSFKQQTVTFSLEECKASLKTPLIVELEKEGEASEEIVCF